jgi:hypothetical protein
VSLVKKLASAGVVVFLSAGSAMAQGVGVGATIGVVNDITDHFHLDEFKAKDVNLWVDYELEPKVLARATFGTLKVHGANAGLEVTPSGSSSSITLPDLADHVDYATADVSYQFWEGDYTSGIFGGFGGYKIRPDSVDPSIASYSDKRETAFGWHAGVDGSFQVVSRLSLIIRLTYHNIRSSPVRSLVTANAGLGYRF